VEILIVAGTVIGDCHCCWDLVEILIVAGTVSGDSHCCWDC
jgi:hypothetical protein